MMFPVYFYTLLLQPCLFKALHFHKVSDTLHSDSQLNSFHVNNAPARLVRSIDAGYDKVQCRDRFGLADPLLFRRRTCAACLKYVNPHAPWSMPNPLAPYLQRKSNQTLVHSGQKISVKTTERPESESGYESNNSKQNGLENADKLNEHVDKSTLNHRTLKGENGINSPKIGFSKTSRSNPNSDTDDAVKPVSYRPGSQAGGELSLNIIVDIDEEESMQAICAEMDARMCSAWKQCCLAASKCCDRQMNSRSSGSTEKYSENDVCDTLGAAGRPRGLESRTLHCYSTWDGNILEDPLDGADRPRNLGSRTPHCEGTWDGYSCFDDTKADSVAHQPCPGFIKEFITTKYSMKTCHNNGTWYAKGERAWTDYTPCLDKQSYVNEVYFSTAFNILSILMLIPAILLFLIFRDLIRQDRIKLHIHFFLSLTLVSVMNILWYFLVHYDLLLNLSDGNGAAGPVIRRNPVWCRLVSFLKIYFTSTNYFWMFCEGYHLHRLISNAFEAPSSALGIYITGWVTPAICSIAYAIVRVFVDNSSCWTKNIGAYQWIIYTPNLLCLAMNLIFLCNILRTLLFQLHVHPHEPSNFRRGLKAGFMLVPLFGMQLLLTIYTPDVGDLGGKQYEYISLAITNSQGIFVSLIFCFFNGEVLAQIRRKFPSLSRRGDAWRNPRGSQANTHITMATDAMNRKEEEMGAGSSRGSAVGDIGDCHPPGVTNLSLVRGGDDDDASDSAIPLQDLRKKPHATSLLNNGKPAGYEPVPT